MNVTTYANHAGTRMDVVAVGKGFKSITRFKKPLAVKLIRHSNWGAVEKRVLRYDMHLLESADAGGGKSHGYFVNCPQRAPGALHRCGAVNEVTDSPDGFGRVSMKCKKCKEAFLAVTSNSMNLKEVIKMSDIDLEKETTAPATTAATKAAAPKKRALKKPVVASGKNSTTTAPKKAAPKKAAPKKAAPKKAAPKKAAPKKVKTPGAPRADFTTMKFKPADPHGKRVGTRLYEILEVMYAHKKPVTVAELHQMLPPKLRSANPVNYVKRVMKEGTRDGYLAES